MSLNLSGSNRYLFNIKNEKQYDKLIAHFKSIPITIFTNEYGTYRGIREYVLRRHIYTNNWTLFNAPNLGSRQKTIEIDLKELLKEDNELSNDTISIFEECYYKDDIKEVLKFVKTVPPFKRTE